MYVREDPRECQTCLSLSLCAVKSGERERPKERPAPLLFKSFKCFIVPQNIASCHK